MNGWVDQSYMTAHIGPALYAQQPQAQPNSRLGPDAVAYLRGHFKADNKPSTAFKRQLALDLNVDIAKINNWFQNERAKTKSLARVEEARRLNGEVIDEKEDSSSPSSSDSPTIEQASSQGPSRPAPLVLTPLLSSNEHSQFDALNLDFRPQTSHFELPAQHGMVPMSAPAHMTSFPQAQLMSHWGDLQQTTPTTFTLPSPSQPLPASTPTFVSETPLLYTEIPQADLAWPAEFAAPLSSGFDTFNSFLNFDTPLHSAQIDGTFSFSSPTEEPTFIADSTPWSIAPQLSPSESYHEQSVVSESLPMTPASFGPEPFHTESQFKDPFLFGNSSMPGDISLVSPGAAFDNVAPVDIADQLPPRPSSTQPSSSFTRKRNIEIPHLSLNSSALPSAQQKLRLAKSMNLLRAPRSPLHPMRDDTRRVSKSPSHVRTPVSAMPPVPPLPDNLC